MPRVLGLLVVSVLLVGCSASSAPTGPAIPTPASRLPAPISTPFQVAATATRSEPPKRMATGPAVDARTFLGQGTLAFVWNGQIVVLGGDTGSVRVIGPPASSTGTVRLSSPKWSPDGEWLAFLRADHPDHFDPSGDLWIARRDGSDLHQESGLPGRIYPDGFAWSPVATRSGDVLAVAPDSGGLWLASPGGSPRLIAARDTRVWSLVWSPNGQDLAYVVTLPNRDVQRRSDALDTVAVGGGTTVHRFVAQQAGIILAGWRPDGQGILVWRDPMHSASLLVDGEPLESLDPGTGKATKLALTDGATRKDLWTLAHRDFLSWSPDGQTLALVVGPGRQTWDQKAIAVALAGQALRRLSPDGVSDLYPAWSPDGKRLAFTSGPEAHGLLGGEKAQQALQGRRIWVMDADGSHRHALTRDPTYRDERPLWSADGTHLLFARFKGDVAQLWLMDADGGNPRLVVGDLTPAPPFFGNNGYTEWASLYDWWRGPARSSASSPPTPIPTATSTAVPTRTPATTATPMPTASADPFAAYLDAARADLGSTEGQAASVTIGAVRLQDLARQRGVRLRYLVPSDAGQVDAWIGFAEPGTAFILWRDGATIRGEVWTSRDQPFFLYFVNPVRAFRLVRQNGALELGLIPASLGSTGDAIFVLARFTEGHWQQVWSPFPAAKDSWASSGGSVELVGPGIDTLHLKGPIPPDVPASRVFDEFGAALKQQYESEWQRQGDRYVRVSGRIVPTPFTALVSFVDRLQRGDRTGAAALAADPSLVDRALQLGLGKPASGRGWWATNETTANGVVTITFFDNADRSRAFAVALMGVNGAWRVKAIDRWQAPNRWDGIDVRGVRPRLTSPPGSVASAHLLLRARGWFRTVLPTNEPRSLRSPESLPLRSGTRIASGTDREDEALY